MRFFYYNIFLKEKFSQFFANLFVTCLYLCLIRFCVAVLLLYLQGCRVQIIQATKLRGSENKRLACQNNIPFFGQHIFKYFKNDNNKWTIFVVCNWGKIPVLRQNAEYFDIIFLPILTYPNLKSGEMATNSYMKTATEERQEGSHSTTNKRLQHPSFTC